MRMIFAAVFMASMVADATAQAPCAPRETVIGNLASKFGETRRAYGVAGTTRVLELYASDNGSWTAVISTPDGRSCVVAAGEGWVESPGGAPVGEPS